MWRAWRLKKGENWKQHSEALLFQKNWVVNEGKKGKCMADRARTISGVFSVYGAEKARDFADCERYPIGFEAVFRNDASGREFAENIQSVMKKMPQERGILFHIEGVESDTARGVDCFFKDVDSFRKVLNEAMPNMVMFHEDEKRILPKMQVLDQAKRLVRSPALCA